MTHKSDIDTLNRKEYIKKYWHYGEGYDEESPNFIIEQLKIEVGLIWDKYNLK